VRTPIIRFRPSSVNTRATGSYNYSMIRLRRLLVPTDFSESARHALTYGISFAREYQAELLLLHVVEMVPVGYASDLFPVPMAEVFQELAGYARNELGKLAAECTGHGVATASWWFKGRPPPRS